MSPAPPTARAPRDADDEPVDDDFLYHLYRGGELLSAGDALTAKDELEQAFALRPRNQRGQNMLGLVYFKLGVFDRAAEIYGGLVRDNPSDPTLRVNLGLVLLKSGRLLDAHRELGVAVDLAPDHKKAQSYLGLVKAQIGDYAGARQAFVAAGSEQMVQKMDRALAGIDSARFAARPAPGTPALAAVAERGFTAIEETEQPFRAVDAERAPRRAEASEGWIAAAPATLRGGDTVLPPTPQTLGEFSQAVRLEPPPGGPFVVSPDGAVIDVERELYTRLDGMVASRGGLSFEPVRKRFRGRTTDKSFGEGPRQVFRTSGKGRILISGHVDPADPARIFTKVTLAEEAVYLVEDHVYAFEEALLFENGRVPGKGADLHLVHVRGTGQVLLSTRRPIRSLAADGSAPLRVPLGTLVGWAGALTPKLLPLAGDPERPLVLTVELAGEGDILLVS